MFETSVDSDKAKFDLALSDLIESFKCNEVTVFAGAGVSIPSGLPDSWTLVESISTAFEIAVERLKIGTIEDRKLVTEIVTTYRLERILDSIAHFHGNPSLNTLLNFHPAEPNYNHKALASLAKRGCLSNIITLNFDVLFEISLQAFEVPFTWHLPLASVLEKSNNAQPIVTITKPHGTLPFDNLPYQDYYLATTLQYTGDHPQEENIQALKSVGLESPVLLVCGYANNDWDIFPILTTVPWKKIFWIQHTHQVPPAVLKWLRNFPPHIVCLIYGDVRILFKEILDQLNILINEPINQNTPIKNPDISTLVSKPAATTFAALSLLDDKRNDLYTTLLEQFRHSEQVAREKHLIETWERAMAWIHHSHERNPRKAIERYRKVIPISSQAAYNDLKRMNDCRSMHYEYISTLKQPYLNKLLLSDIFYVIGWRKELLSRTRKTELSRETNPMDKKESKRLQSLVRYDVVDLFHNWAYHLLPFTNRLIRGIIKWVFKQISRSYDRLAKQNPDMDWEYRFIRRVESHLIAFNSVDKFMKDKIDKVYEMFKQTDRSGHHAYTESVLAIMHSDFKAFRSAKESLNNPSGISTPSGMLRMILLQRYFWPGRVSSCVILKSFLKKSKPRK